MATKYEQAAGIVQAWVGTYGNADMKNIADDVVEILRICHEFRTPSSKKAPIFDADDLGDAIADYVMEVYSSPVNFDKGDAETAHPSEGADPQSDLSMGVDSTHTPSDGVSTTEHTQLDIPS
jgi:hypothetical protein